jgi:hypothetical protein
MKHKLIGIIICMLLVGTVLPVSGNNLEETSGHIPDVSVYIESGNYPETRLGCKGVISYHGHDNITLNVSFSVISYSLQLEYLGESSYTYESTFHEHQSDHPHIIPDNYGETFTWVLAKLDVKNVDNSEQTESDFRIGLSMGNWIYFSRVLTIIGYIIDFLT